MRRLIAYAIIIPVASYLPAYAQSMVDTEALARLAEIIGSDAEMMSVCLKDKSGLAKVDKLLGLTPPQIRSLWESHLRIGIEKGMEQLAYAEGSWHRMECSSPAVQNSLREVFDNLMAQLGVQ